MMNNDYKMLEKLNSITEFNKNNGIVDVTISADSINSFGDRITSFIIHRLPKGAVQAEFNTHRTISRNSASARAINKQKYVEMLRKDPYIPIWTYNKKGMTGELIEDQSLVDELTSKWLESMETVISIHQLELYDSVAKQDINPILDPYIRVPIIATSTNWEYFFKLRTNSDVKPEFRRLALIMQDLFNTNIPIETECHLPWITQEELNSELINYHLMVLSTARSAWISLNNHNGDGSIETAKSTVDSLIKHQHGSPLDHACVSNFVFSTNEQNKLYKGWTEFRKIVNIENK